MSQQALRVKCPTWEHAENFITRKVKDGNLLSVRLPFAPAVSGGILLALELPDGVVLDIDCEVLDVRATVDGHKSAALLRLDGLTSALRQRLERAIETGRGGRARPNPLFELSRPGAAPLTRSGAPVPVPIDAPIDEIIEPLRVPVSSEVPEAAREIFEGLEAELQRLRQKPAHEVLGVSFDASVEEIRGAYLELGKSYHPDVYARHRSPEVSLLVSEVFIHINRAYDRLRDAAVAAGCAIVAGPALLPHDGWLAGFEDLGAIKPRPPLRSDDVTAPVGGGDVAAGPVEVRFEGAAAEAVRFEATAPVEPLTEDSLFDEAARTDPGVEALDGGLAPSPRKTLRMRAHSAFDDERYDVARLALAELLRASPRDREARALYHVAHGRLLAESGKRVEALQSYEAALAHDRDCAPARAGLAELSPPRARRKSLLKRLFRR